MDIKALIERLRWYEYNWKIFSDPRGSASGDCGQAADALASLVRERDACVRQVGEEARLRGAAEARADALEARLAEAAERTLNAASDYLQETYGYGVLSNPVDRARILAKMEMTDDPA